jgi:hypothetical protein
MTPDDRSYFASPALSKSRIDLLLECPALYKADLDGLGEQKDSAALRFGSMFHLLTLQPEFFDREYAIQELPLTTKAGKAWRDSLPDDIAVVKPEDYERALLMADAVREHPQAKFLFHDYEAEKSIEWTFDGVDCKCKPDIIANVGGTRYLADLKTTDSVNPSEISRSIAKWHYYRQAAWYLLGMEQTGRPCDAFIFIFVSKTAPHLVTMCQLDDEALKLGLDECMQAVATLKQCRETGVYPCYTRDILTLGLPKWAAKGE